MPALSKVSHALWCYTVLSLLVLAVPLGAATQPITSVSEIRLLASQDAARQLPVRLDGVVIDGPEPIGAAFVLLDGEHGIYVKGPPELVSGLRFGDQVEIEGVTDPGNFAPFVEVQNVIPLGAGNIPPPHRATIGELYSGSLDAQWVEISGIIRSCRPMRPIEMPTAEGASGGSPSSEKKRTLLVVASGTERMQVQVNADLDPSTMVDAEVVLRGLCFNRHNNKRQFIQPLLLVPRPSLVFVTQPPPDAPLDAPVVDAASILRFSPQKRYDHRVHVQGVVTHVQEDESLWLRSEGESLLIRAEDTAGAKIGDHIDVLGFPMVGEYNPVLENATCVISSSGDEPEPVHLASYSEGIGAGMELVELDATLLEARLLENSADLLLDWNGDRIEARLALDPSMREMPALPAAGSLLRLTGIGIVSAPRVGPVSGVVEPGGFRLKLRDLRDIRVLKDAPWWTPERVVRLLLVFLILSVLAVLTSIIISRRRVMEQRNRREMAETEFRAILKERNRLAREIHDTLSQGLGAISVQLEIVRTRSTSLGSVGATHLGRAQQLVRDALREARNSIWNMRSQILEHSDLANAIGVVLKQLTEGMDIKGNMRLEGVPRRLPPVVENNLLRIAQESITNAVKHSGASTIDVRLTFAPEQVFLVVSDDGRGLDESHSEPGPRGSFGLLGIQERADECGAELSIDSRNERGTRIVIRVAE